MITLYYAKLIEKKPQSEMFLKSILSKYFKIDTEKLSISKSFNGKPYLEDYPLIHYNISHTKDFIVCVITNQPVGVDVEEIRILKMNVIDKYYTSFEKNYVLSTKVNRNKRFTEIWTKKEAFVKSTGRGIELPLQEFEVLIEKKNIKTICIENTYIISICYLENHLINDNKIEIIEVMKNT